MIIETFHTPDAKEIREFLLKFSNTLFFLEPSYLSLVQQQLGCKICWLLNSKIGQYRIEYGLSEDGKIFRRLGKHEFCSLGHSNKPDSFDNEAVCRERY